MINPQYRNIMRGRDSRWIFLFIRREASKIREEERFSAIRLDLIIRGLLLSRKLIVEIFMQSTEVVF